MLTVIWATAPLPLVVEALVPAGLAAPVPEGLAAPLLALPDPPEVTPETGWPAAAQPSVKPGNRKQVIG